MAEIKNNTDKMMFFNKSSGILEKDIWKHLTFDTLSNANYDNHLKNTRHLIQSPDIYEPVINEIYPIPSKSSWHFSGTKFICSQNLMVQKNSIDIKKIFHKIIRPLKKYKIGVELSGGLDSSLIISILRQNGIEPFLIGFSSNRYEFRTERHIQELYKNESVEYELIDSSDLYPLKGLLNTPQHQLPYHSSLWYYSKSFIANRCKEHNIDLLFSGMAGDTIFCEKVGNSFPYEWHNWQMDYGWFHEYVFIDQGLKYMPVYSKSLVDEIFKLRKNQEYDSQKKWARDFFKDYLPNELVSYNYKSDYIGEVLEGIKRAYSDISELFYITNKILKSKEFSKEKLSILFNQIEKYDNDQLNEIFSKVSFANWIYSLSKRL
jgi:hypothetical protein